MADFDVNTITVQGAVAIASATAGDKLVIDGCDATTDVLTQAQAVQIATRPASPASTTDTIGLAGSTDNHVYAYASFIRGESTGGDVNSFLLYGHMESDASTVFVVAVASATAPTHIPTSGDVTNRVEIQFELTFSATDEVVTVTDTSMYTTRGEFLILKNRTVTTHAEGQATVGEDQTVYGKKEFMDDMIFNGMYQVQAKSVEGQNTQNMFAFTQNGERQNYGPTVTAMTTYNGTSYVSSTTSIGAAALLGIAGGASFSAEHKAVGDPNAAMEATRGLGGAYAGVVVEPTQVTLYTQAASGGARRTLSYTGGQLTGSFDTISTSKDELNIYVRASLADIDMYFDATTPDSTWSVALTNVNTDKTATLTFYAGADSGGQLTCVSATGGTSKLGTGDTPWDEAHISVLEQADGQVLIDDSGVNTINLNPINSNESINVYGNLIPGNSRFCLGSNVKQWNKAYINEIVVGSAHSISLDGNTDNIMIDSDFLPESGSQYDLGSDGQQWNDVYVGSRIHSPLITGDQEELTLYAQGTGNGKSEIGMYCTNSSVSVSINLQANQESNVVYAFTRYSLSGPGKDLGYQNGGEWNNIYAKNLHGKLPAPELNAPNDPPIGTIFLACIERDSSSSSYVLNAGVNLRPGYDPTCIGIYYAIITSWNTVTGGHSIAFCKGTALPGYNGTTGVYRTLSMADFNSYLSTYVLVMRVA